MTFESDKIDAVNNLNGRFGNAAFIRVQKNKTIDCKKFIKLAHVPDYVGNLSNYDGDANKNATQKTTPSCKIVQTLSVKNDFLMKNTSWLTKETGH